MFSAMRGSKHAWPCTVIHWPFCSPACWLYLQKRWLPFRLQFPRATSFSPNHSSKLQGALWFIRHFMAQRKQDAVCGSPLSCIAMSSQYLSWTESWWKEKSPSVRMSRFDVAEKATFFSLFLWSIIKILGTQTDGQIQLDFPRFLELICSFLSNSIDFPQI